MSPEEDRPQSDNRRQHRRAAIHFEAVLEGERPEDNLRLTVLNFSAGGFFCTTSRPLELMTKLGVRFQFPPFGDHETREIGGEALVVRCQEPREPGQDYRMAACFIELPDEAREHIHAYVAWSALQEERTPSV